LVSEGTANEKPDILWEVVEGPEPNEGAINEAEDDELTIGSAGAAENDADDVDDVDDADDRKGVLGEINSEEEDEEEEEEEEERKLKGLETVLRFAGPLEGPKGDWDMKEKGELLLKTDLVISCVDDANEFPLTEGTLGLEKFKSEEDEKIEEPDFSVEGLLSTLEEEEPLKTKLEGEEDDVCAWNAKVPREVLGKDWIEVITLLAPFESSFILLLLLLLLLVALSLLGLLLMRNENFPRSEPEPVFSDMVLLGTFRNGAVSVV